MDRYVSIFADYVTNHLLCTNLGVTSACFCVFSCLFFRQMQPSVPMAAAPSVAPMVINTPSFLVPSPHVPMQQPPSPLLLSPPPFMTPRHQRMMSSDAALPASSYFSRARASSMNGSMHTSTAMARTPPMQSPPMSPMFKCDQKQPPLERSTSLPLSVNGNVFTYSPMCSPHRSPTPDGDNSLPSFRALGLAGTDHRRRPSSDMVRQNSPDTRQVPDTRHVPDMRQALSTCTQQGIITVEQAEMLLKFTPEQLYTVLRSM